VRHRGGGHKRMLRDVDFRREKYGIPARVEGIEYDPNRSAHLALLVYRDGEKRYIIAPYGLKAGDVVMSGPQADILPGNALPIRNIPVGTLVHNVELQPGRGAQLCRSAGAQAQLSGEALSSDERGRPDGEAALRSAFDGEQLQVAPDSRCPPCDRIAGEGGASDVVVVLDLERSETGRTDEARAERLRPAAGATAQAADVGSPLGQRVGRCGIRRGSRFGGRRRLHWSDRCLEGHVDRRLRLRRSIAGAPGNRETLPGGRAWEGSLISQEDLPGFGTVPASLPVGCRASQGRSLRHS